MIGFSGVAGSIPHHVHQRNYQPFVSKLIRFKRSLDAVLANLKSIRQHSVQHFTLCSSLWDCSWNNRRVLTQSYDFVCQELGPQDSILNFDQETLQQIRTVGPGGSYVLSQVLYDSAEFTSQVCIQVFDHFLFIP